MSPADEPPADPVRSLPDLPPASVPYRRDLIHGREISIYYDRQRSVLIADHRHVGDVQVMLVFEPGECVLTVTSPAGPQPYVLVGLQLMVIASNLLHGCQWGREGELIVLYVWHRLWRELTNREIADVLCGEATAAADRDFVLWKLAATLRDLCDERTGMDVDSVEGVAREIVRRLGTRLAITAPTVAIARGPVLTESQLRKVDDYLNAHLAHDIHVADLERCLGLASTQVTELFKRTVDLTPYDYIKQRRMFKAHELLRTGDYRLNEVATLVGYQDAGYFSSEFKKWIGVAPRRLVENARQFVGKSPRKP